MHIHSQIMCATAALMVCTVLLLQRPAVVCAASSAAQNAKLCKPGQASTSGVIQMTYSSCSPWSFEVDNNNLLSLCAPAFKVDVNAKGIMYLTPMEQGRAVKWAGPGDFALPTAADKKGFNWGIFQCKDMNATGTFNGTDKSAAALWFYNDVNSTTQSRLVATGSNKLTLSAGNTKEYGYGIDSSCTYNFVVASGCVMGIQAAKPYTCPAGWYSKTGRGKYADVRYCAPCPLGTSSSRPGSTKCTPCQPGYASPSLFGSKACEQCMKETGDYSSKPGSVICNFCNETQEDDKNGTPYGRVSIAHTKYTDGKTCKACPPDSWSLQSNRSQCVACNNGVKCCRTNPSKDCPPCKPGLKPAAGKKSATFVLTAASPPSCWKETQALCSTSFTVTIQPTCQLKYQVNNGLDPADCDGVLPKASDIVGSKISFNDLSGFNPEILGAGVVRSKQPASITFKTTISSVPGWDDRTCSFTYRSISSGGSTFGVPPAPCPAGKPGCVSKAKPRMCPAGHYVKKNIDGNTLCLPCPPGHYAKSASSSTQCTPCPAGSYAPTYMNKVCKLCPLGTFSKKASLTCIGCGRFKNQSSEWLLEPFNDDPGFYSSKAGSATCKACPENSRAAYVTGDDPQFVLAYSSCLGRIHGKLCCAAGNCSGQQACSGKLSKEEQLWDYATLQLQSSKHNHPSCRNATLFKCLAPKAFVAVSSTTYFLTDASVEPINQPKCHMVSEFDSTSRWFGRYTATNRLRFQSSNIDTPGIYEAVSDAATGTVRMYFTPKTPAPYLLGPAKVKCSATFKLTAGYAFDLGPPKGAKCPPGMGTANKYGRQYCNTCPEGWVMKNGKCQICPRGTYHPYLGGSKCISCPVGTQSTSGSSSCSTCPPGTIASGDRNRCITCPANRFAAERALKCKACPAGTVSQKGSQSCSIPFPM